MRRTERTTACARAHPSRDTSTARTRRASTSHHSYSCAEAGSEDSAPALKRRREDTSAATCAYAEDGCVVTSPRASGQDVSKDRASNSDAGHGKLGWLIGQLMGTREPGFMRDGQPCVSVRDRILTLLRPMMNFQEKVTFFQEEQERMMDYEMEHEMDFGADETLHIQVHRGQEILVDTVEQILAVDKEMLHRELTVEFLGEEGEDGGGLLREFCHVRPRASVSCCVRSIAMSCRLCALDLCAAGIC
jgi:hypothetical protein